MRRGPKRRDPVDRFIEKVHIGKPDECWEWTGCLYPGTGYGEFGVYLESEQRWVTRGAHRFAYELWVGPIPDGLQLDHLCRIRRCVNPAHLEPVTNRENGRRGRAVEATKAHRANQTHCKRGHLLPEPNKFGVRVCLPCCAARMAGYRSQRPKAPPRTTCRNGHPLEGNRYVSPGGEALCRECLRAREARHKARKKLA